MPLVRAATMEAMLERLYADDAPLAVVLGFRPVVPGAYGRIIAGRGGMIEKMVEYKDASEEERAVTLCNSGLMAVRQEDLFTLLARVENNNAAGEYYLPDIVMLALKEGRRSAVIEADSWEVAGVNSRLELAEVEAEWQRRRRLSVMHDGTTLIAPEPVLLSHETLIVKDAQDRKRVVSVKRG